MNGTNDSEVALLTALDREAPATPGGAEIIRLYGAKAESAVRLAFHITRDREAALDLSQEAFVKAIKGLSTLDDPSRMEAWFDRIVVNLCRDWLRRRKNERRALDGARSVQHRTVVLPAEPLEAEEEVERVRAAMLDLPLDLRETFATVCIEGLSTKKAAFVLDVPEGTLRWRLREARRKLRECLR